MFTQQMFLYIWFSSFFIVSIPYQYLFHVSKFMKHFWASDTQQSHIQIEALGLSTLQMLRVICYLWMSYLMYVICILLFIINQEYHPKTDVFLGTGTVHVLGLYYENCCSNLKSDEILINIPSEIIY